MKQEKIISNPIDKVLPLGPFIVDEKHAYNSYLIQGESLNILVDVMPIQVLDLQKTAIQKTIEINQLSHIIIHGMHMSSINTLIELIDEGFKGIIITNTFFARQIKNAQLPVEILTIEAMNYKWIFDKKVIMNFIPMVFLPYPEMFMTYLQPLESLFSSILYSNYYEDSKSITLDYLKQSIYDYHKDHMPTTEFVRIPLRVIDKFEIAHIYPQMGHIIPENDIDQITEYLLKMDFYNTYVVYKFNEAHEKEINFIEVINHMILKLEQYIPRIEILNTLIGTPFSLDSNTLELKKSILSGYKLWHGFFEHLYIKHGISWLSILEPMVNRYAEHHSIELPNIYQSQILGLTEAQKKLELEKAELELKLKELKEQADQARDEILKCPITHLYYPEVLKKMLTHDLAESKTDHTPLGLALVQLDNLNEINRKYGKETGDEAIRNLAYQISQIKKDESLVFKQNGPGIYIYLPQTSITDMQACALGLRNSVMKSDVFIEDTSVSIAIVTQDEIIKDQPVEDQIKDLFSLLDRRIMLAKTQGKASIIDQSFQLPQLDEGSILLVDEDEVSRNMLYRIFNRIHFRVMLATSVQEAIEIVSKSQIDVIISEINLSKIDGFTLKQMLNETKAHKEIPFIMVSHNKTLDNIKRGNTLDVDLMLEKPIIPEELIGHVKRFKDRKTML
jgi:diguanylate cyclase (GGDEF)-like protein